MQFQVLKPYQVHKLWPIICPLLDKAVIHGRGEVWVDDILDLVLNNKMFVAVVIDNDEIILAIAAEVLYYPRRSVLNIAFAGGKRADVLAREFYPRFEEMARIMKTDAMQCSCRPSIVRLLKRLDPGVEEVYIVVEKRVSDENKS